MKNRRELDLNKVQYWLAPNNGSCVIPHLFNHSRVIIHVFGGSRVRIHLIDGRAERLPLFDLKV